MSAPAKRFRLSSLQPAPLAIIAGFVAVLAWLAVHHARQPKLDWSELGDQITALSGVATVATLLLALVQYARAEQWKRAEFVAGEMKQFFDDPKVQLVLTMIDWSPRRINLHGLTAEDRDKWPVVSYETQISALLPHTALSGRSDRTEDAPRGGTATTKDRYTNDEAVIRDAYDRFLDCLDRFGAHLDSRLVRYEELRPYLGYWLDDIAKPSASAEWNAWTLSVLRYIETYEYRHVPTLFAAAGHGIGPDGEIYAKLAADTEAGRLIETARRTPAPKSPK